MSGTPVRRLSACACTLLAFAGGLGVFGCVGSEKPVESPTYGDSGEERHFAYVTLEGARLDSATTRGRYTVLLFLTTYDLSCQLAARQLEDLYRGQAPRINAAAIVLEPPQNAPLAEAFLSALSLSYPVAMADRLTLVGDSTFGRISTIPTYVVLNRDGREIWRSEGFTPPETVKSKLR